MVSLASNRCPQCGGSVPKHGLEGLCATCLLGGALEVGREEDEPPRVVDPFRGTRSLGDYEILGRIGRGGMGVVFKASHPDYAELVAIKTIASGDLAAPQDVRRFRLEAESIERLKHRHIVPVYEVCEEDGLHYFVMKLAEGGSLEDLVGGVRGGDRFGELSTREAAGLVSKVARGIHFAHQRGVLHRDLKPGNILLDSEGEPMIADFGLAKLAHASTQLTLAGSALGTPAYMSPEQATGDSSELTTAADVYSLGAILYFLLTGRPPFAAPTALEVLRRINTEQPVTPRRAGSRVDRDLELICLRCLEKAPGSRYASAGGLADDLERWLAGEAIEARPATSVERIRRWARRRPVLAATSLLGAVAALALALVLSVATVLLQRQRNIAIEHEGSAREMATRAGEEAKRTRLNLYAADMFLTGGAIEDGNLGLARSSLARHVPAPGEEDLRGFEWFAYHRLCRGDEELAFRGHTGAVIGVAFNSDGSRLATAGRDERVMVWSTEDGALLKSLPEADAPVGAAEFILISNLAAKSPEALNFLLRRTGTLDEIRMRSRPSRLGEFKSLAWSHDGKILATGGIGSFLRLWEIESGSLVGLIPITFSRELAFTPNDAHLVVAVDKFGGKPTEVRVYSRTGLDRIRTISNVRPAFGLSGDGRRLAVVGHHREVVVQDFATGTPLRKWTVPEPVDRLALNADGTMLATLEDAGRKLAFWDVRNGRALGRIVIAPDRFNSLTFTPDGGTLVAASSDHSLRLYDTRTFRERDVLRGHDDEVLAIACSPSGAVFASGGNDHTARIWPVARRAQVDADVKMPGAPTTVSPDGGYVLMQSPEGDVRCGRLPGPRASVAGRGVGLGFSPDSKHFVSVRRAEGDEPILVRRRVDGSGEAREIEVPGAPRDWMVAGAAMQAGIFGLGAKEEGVSVYLVRNGELVRQLEESEGLDGGRFRFSADGSRLACLSWPRTIRAWDVRSGRRLRKWRASDGTVSSIAFSPDGSLLASGGDDNLVSIWDLEKGGSPLVLRGHKAEVKALAFSNDGRTLGSAGRDLTLRLWHVPTWRDLGVLSRGELFSLLEFQEDDSALLVGRPGQAVRRIEAKD